MILIIEKECWKKTKKYVFKLSSNYTLLSEQVLEARNDSSSLCYKDRCTDVRTYLIYFCCKIVVQLIGRWEMTCN